MARHDKLTQNQDSLANSINILTAGGGTGCPSLRLEISQTGGGRFESHVHIVSTKEPGELLLRSDDESLNDWPNSPPIQECLDYETHGIRPGVLLATGMARTSHWSASIESATTHGNDAIQWDIACRTNVRPQFLGSTWIVSDRATTTMLEMEPSKVAISLPVDSNPSWKNNTFQIFAMDESRIELQKKRGSTIVQVLPANLHDDLPATFRWKYRICLKSFD